MPGILQPSCLKGAFYFLVSVCCGDPKLLSYSKGFKLLGGYFLLAEALDLLELLAFVILSVSILGACLHSAKPKETWERMERRLAFPVCLCAFPQQPHKVRTTVCI